MICVNSSAITLEMVLQILENRLIELKNSLVGIKIEVLKRNIVNNFPIYTFYNISQ